MESLFKKFIYTGVGIVSTVNGKFQKDVNEWVAKGKLTEEEGKKVVNDLVHDTEDKKSEYEGKLKDYTEKFLARFDFPTRDEITNLHAKVEELEAKLAASATETEPTEEKVEAKA